MITAKQAIYDQQRRWATTRGIPFDRDGYTQIVEANLFQPLGTQSRAEFEAGSGDEVGGVGRRGKMQALHSSSALVCKPESWVEIIMTVAFSIISSISARKSEYNLMSTCLPHLAAN